MSSQSRCCHVPWRRWMARHLHQCARIGPTSPPAAYPLHPVPCEVDSEARFRQLRRNLVRWQIYAPVPVPPSCRPEAECGAQLRRSSLCSRSNADNPGTCAVRPTIEAEVVSFGICLCPQIVQFCSSGKHPAGQRNVTTTRQHGGTAHALSGAHHLSTLATELLYGPQNH